MIMTSCRLHLCARVADLLSHNSRKSTDQMLMKMEKATVSSLSKRTLYFVICNVPVLYY